MKKTIFSILALAAFTLPIGAIDNNTVEVVYNGTTATITVAPNISSYVTVQSGTSSHVKLVQDANFAGVDKTVDNEDGEIIYVLSGTSTDGEFYMEGAFKATVELSGLTLTNPSGPALNIQDGKRISLSAKKGTTSTLTDGANEAYNGCIHIKGHTKLKGKGTLNVAGRSKHGIYSKEYLEVKNLTLNITAAEKDGLHCKEYFLMESGTVSITGAQDDAIQVELGGTTSTGTTTNHEDEDSGNFYMTGGTLTLAGYQGQAIKADGTITYSGGKQNFDTANTKIYADVQSSTFHLSSSTKAFYDLQGRKTTESQAAKGLYIMKAQDGKTIKRMK